MKKRKVAAKKAAPKRRVVKKRVLKKRVVRKNPVKKVKTMARKRKRVVRRKKRVARKPAKRRVVRRKPVRRKRVVKRKRAMRRNPVKRKRVVRRKRRAAAPKRRRVYKKRAAPKRRKSIRRKSYRRNPSVDIKKPGSLIKAALAGGAGFFAGRILGNKLAVASAMPDNMRQYAPMLGNAAALLGAYYAGKKIKALKEYQDHMMVGALVSMVETIVAQWGPAEVQALVSPPIGLGSDLDVYASALQGYGLQGALAADDIGEYISEPGMSEYISEPGMSEYISEPGLNEFDIEEAVAGSSLSGNSLGLEVEEAVAGPF